MTGVNDDELRSLRARAYGPGADIHRDPRALQRLRELEGSVARRQPDHSDARVEPVSAPVAHRARVDAETEHVAPEVEVEVEHPAYKSFRPLSRVRRSSWLIALATTLIVAVVAAALVLVQRVQIDPLQVGATQVARLSLDATYDIPGFFAGFATAGRDVQAFQEFHGIRAVVTTGEVFVSGSDDDCLSVYSAAIVTNSDLNSFGGRILVGCAAGPFPAMTQVRSDDQEFPDQLQSAFPGSTAFQFVYDPANNEVVVFAGT